MSPCSGTWVSQARSSRSVRRSASAAAPAIDDEALGQVREELADRYGDLPAPVLALLRVSQLRRTAQKAGLSDVVVMGSNLRLVGRELPDSKQLRLQRMYPGSKWWGQTRTAQVASDDDLN